MSDSEKAHKIIHALLLSISLIIMTVATISCGFAVTWSSALPVTDPPLPSMDMLPSITQTSDGKIWVVWQSDILGNCDVLYSVYDWSTWTLPDMLTTDPDNKYDPFILQASNGTLWLFWGSDKYGNSDIFFKTSSDAGLNWSDEQPLVTGAYNDGHPSAMESGDGKIWVVWQRLVSGGNYDLFYAVYDGSWSSEFLLNSNPYADQMPSIAQMADGRIWVAWCSYRAEEWNIFYKIYESPSWSSEFQLPTSPDDDQSPSLVQARDGTIWIVWSSSKPTATAQDDLYYKTSTDNGATWSASNPLTATNDDDKWPQIAQINDKTLWVVWTSDMSDSNDIFYKTSSEITIHDVAITNVTPSQTVVDQGEIVSIDVVAENQGEMTETFTVDCYADSTLVGSQTITLTPANSTTLTFLWDTSSAAPSTYVIKSTASAVPEETAPNLDDNTFTDGTVTVTSHDVAVTNVYPLKASAAQGYITKIYVEVKNEGTISESFNVTAYYSSIPIGTQRVNGLNPSASTTLTFDWNTYNVPLGNYTISATAETVPGEIDTDDNSFTDGTVRVKLPGDVDGDGDVDIEDISLIARAFGTDPRWPSGTDWYQWNPEADINNDDLVDIWDLDIGVDNYGRVGG